ncbi:CheR family methyltransferase [Chitinibacter sp. GC72]|uniref:CheR family methyltransferase n=1 Tax=Chitinibacter sp. GC72 TaxID=1526917 RepID=UPI0012FCC68E|nr:CheR family methyltransferase [Chitinibacter sp. GC72]
MQNDHEFSYSKTDFAKVVELIYQRAGIRLNESKEQMVYSRLARRLRALRINTFSGYLKSLENDPDSPEWQQFINALTTNLTSFFREAHHFEILASQMQSCASRPFRIWCAASSTGEEPYSLAMTAIEAYQMAQPPVEIIASDLDTHVLATAAQGVYTIDKLDKMDLERKRGFFLKGSQANAGKVRAKKALRDLIEFKQINLLDTRWPLEGRFDAIFCRNVMIYFDQPTQKVLLEKIGHLLKPDGLLYVGHSENLHYMSEWYRSFGKTTYRLTDRAKAAWSRT